MRKKAAKKVQKLVNDNDKNLLKTLYHKLGLEKLQKLNNTSKYNIAKKFYKTNSVKDNWGK